MQNIDSNFFPSKKKSFLCDLLYLPPTPFFIAISQANHIYFDLFSPFKKQSFQTRAQMIAPSGKKDLIIPTKHPRNGLPYHKILLDNRLDWREKHLKCIDYTYKKMPYGWYICDLLRPIYEKKQQYLYEFNFQMLATILDFLKIPIQLHLVKEKQEAPNIPKEIFHPKKPWPTLFYSLYYRQRFSPMFIPNLSIIDAIATHGASIEWTW